MSSVAERLVEVFGTESVGTFDIPHHVPGWTNATPVLSPQNLEEVSEAFRFAAREGLQVLPAGAGEHLYLGAPPQRCDFVLSARRLDRIVEYEAEEMVMVAQAGVTLHRIEAATAPHGQRLAPDAWPGTAATIGGATAARRSNLNRLAVGAFRDVVLGARVVHADGRVSKTGGKVVKNVAGFDLAKLYVGSCGSLAFLAEINVRLAPRPLSSAVVTATLERARARDMLLAVQRASLQPNALLLIAGLTSPSLRLAPHRVQVLARFEGRERAVRWQVETARALLDGNEIEPRVAGQVYDDLRAFTEAAPDATQVRIHALPVAVCDVVEAFDSVAHLGDGMLAQFGVGLVHLRLRRTDAKRLESLAARIARQGGRLVVEHAPAEVQWAARAELQSGVEALNRHTKMAFDPAGMLRPAPAAFQEAARSDA